jgi:lipid-binding SYLF domain-containing protein
MTWLMNRKPLYLGAIVACCLCVSANAEWQADSSDKKQVKAATAIAKFREKMPQIESYFEAAHGFAIIPGITRVAIGFGGAYGRGLVVEGDELIGKTSFSQFSSGLQLGAKYFSMIVFFKDEAALDDYKKSQMQFLGQAGIDIATFGVSGTPAYNEGVALFAVNRFGLMAEFSYSGAHFKYRPLDSNKQLVDAAEQH